MINLSVTQLRNLIQMPERPFEDTYAFDGTSYFDLSQREACTMLGVSGTSGGVPRNFILGTDYQLTAGCIDWTVVGAHKPDVNTQFIVDYTYSRLGGVAASTAVSNAQIIVAQDLGSSYPYGTSSVAGISTDLLATYAASLVAARDACKTLQGSDIDLSQKARRGAVLVDDSKKTADWAVMASDWDRQYKRYLTMVRPGGKPSAFLVVSKNVCQLLFGEAEARAFDGCGFDAGFPNSGIF